MTWVPTAAQFDRRTSTGWPARSEIRSRLQPISALQPEPLVVSHGATPRRDGRFDESLQKPHVAALPREASRYSDASATIPRGRLVCRPGPQTLPLWRAERHRHLEPRRLPFVGPDDQSARLGSGSHDSIFSLLPGSSAGRSAGWPTKDRTKSTPMASARRSGSAARAFQARGRAFSWRLAFIDRTPRMSRPKQISISTP